MHHFPNPKLRKAQSIYNSKHKVFNFDIDAVNCNFSIVNPPSKNNPGGVCYWVSEQFCWFVRSVSAGLLLSSADEQCFPPINFGSRRRRYWFSVPVDGHRVKHFLGGWFPAKILRSRGRFGTSFSVHLPAAFWAARCFWRLDFPVLFFQSEGGNWAGSLVLVCL